MDDKLVRAMRQAVLDDLAEESEPAQKQNDASLGKLAVSMGLVSEEQLAECVAEQKKEAGGLTLGQVMLRRKVLSARDLMWALCRQRENRGLSSEMIGRYLVLGELGRGSGGVVYRAMHKDLDKEIALKVMVEHPELPAGLLDRFRREARIAGGLRHPNIVGVHDVGSEGSRHYIAMDLIDGPTLGRWMSARPDRPVGDKVKLLARVAAALDYAHGKGVVHRDLKPANVLLDAKDEPHVTDFGLARNITGIVNLTMSGSVLGTPVYMAPEQIRGRMHKIDGRTDVYALGVILYELLTGTLPFRGETPAEVFENVLGLEPVPPSRVRPGVPRALEVVCLKAMSKEPGRRYATAGEFAEDLDRFLRGEPVLARPPSLREKVFRVLQRRAAVIAVAVAALIAAAVIFLRPSPKPVVITHQEPEPVDAGDFNQRAWSRMEKGDLKGAFEDYTRAIALQPDFAPAYFYRAMVHQKMGNDEPMVADLDEAIRRMEAASSWDPHFLAAYLMRADYRFRKERWEASAEDYSKAIRQQPTCVEALGGRGICYLRLNRYRESVEDLERALKLDPSAPNLSPLLAEARKRTPVEAKHFFDYGSGKRVSNVEVVPSQATAVRTPGGEERGWVMRHPGASALTVRFDAPAAPLDAVLDLDHASFSGDDLQSKDTSVIGILVNGEFLVKEWAVCRHQFGTTDTQRATFLLRPGGNTIEIRLVGGRLPYWLRRFELRCLYPPATVLPPEKK